jgi:hypothetical protein
MSIQSRDPETLILQSINQPTKSKSPPYENKLFCLSHLAMHRRAVGADEDAVRDTSPHPAGVSQRGVAIGARAVGWQAQQAQQLACLFGAGCCLARAWPANPIPSPTHNQDARTCAAMLLAPSIRSNRIDQSIDQPNRIDSCSAAVDDDKGQQAPFPSFRPRSPPQAQPRPLAALLQLPLPFAGAGWLDRSTDGRMDGSCAFFGWYECRSVLLDWHGAWWHDVEGRSRIHGPISKKWAIENRPAHARSPSIDSIDLIEGVRVDQSTARHTERGACCVKADEG